MSLKSTLSKPYAHWVKRQIKQWSSKPIESQKKVFHHIIAQAKNTVFGQEHGFSSISSFQDFARQVPIRDYEGFAPYIQKIQQGRQDLLWPGLPMYFAKTSGTTSGAKYIPISKDSIHNHIDSARIALLNYIAQTGKSDFVDGKMIFLQGSPKLDTSGIVPTGRLSGIVANHVPTYLQKNRMPSFETNCIEDWEQKVEAVVKETAHQDMRLISGIPPWVQGYFEKLLDYTGKKTIKDIFPNFSLFVYGGVNFEPYRPIFEKLVGDKTDSIQLFPASEGFIAFQDDFSQEGMLLIVNSGVFYEFVPVDEMGKPNPARLTIEGVELGKQYAIILSNNAGLWAYNIGDTVKFVSKAPYRIVVTGRIKHYTSAFGEHVIAEEVESSMREALQKMPADVVDFHVAPQVNPNAGELPYHEWFIEFLKEPEDVDRFAALLNEAMCQKNIYYRDLIKGHLLQPLKISHVNKHGFIEYMKSQGKLGGQNKTPRLANDRKMADRLTKINNT